MPSPISRPDVTSLSATLRLGRHRGDAQRVSASATVPVTIAPSWVLGIVLTAWTVGDALLPDAVPDRSAVAYAATAVATAAALALTLAFHEAAHAVVAHRLGLGVRRITLSFVGGALELTDPPATAGTALRIAMAGPVASAAAAVIATLAHIVFSMADVDPLICAAASVVAIGNLLVALFNCIPALPLDGGRVLQAAAWMVTGRERSASMLAAHAGRILAVALLVVAVVTSASGDAALAIWLALLGLTVRAA